MAFAINNFNNVTSGAADSPRKWSYQTTADTMATCLAADYFLPVSNGLDVDDEIFIQASDVIGTFRVLTASGTAQTMGPSVGVLQNRTTITAAQVLLLATTQISLVPAMGANFINLFQGCSIQLDWNATAYTEAADNLVVVYTNASGVVVSQVIEMTGFITLVADSMTVGLPVINPIVANTAAENQALVLDNNNANFGNAGDSPLVVDCYYTVVNGV